MFYLFDLEAWVMMGRCQVYISRGYDLVDPVNCIVINNVEEKVDTIADMVAYLFLLLLLFSF